MSSTPIITTIIPTFRRPERLKKAIQSVLNQTYPHFKICVYDNCSGDETEYVVKEFMEKDPRVNYHCHPENIGALRNFRYGAQRVDTPYFSFLADDDRLLPWFYETVMPGFEQFPDIGFSGGASLCIEAKNIMWKAYRSTESPRHYDPGEALQTLASWNFPMWAAIVFKRECLEKTGGINADIDLIDIDFLYRCSAYFSCALSTKPCSMYVRHAGSFSYIVKLNAFYPLFKTLEELGREAPAFVKIKPTLDKLFAKQFSGWFFIYALMLIREEQYKEAIKYAVYIKRHLAPKSLSTWILCWVKRCRGSRLFRWIFRKMSDLSVRCVVYTNRSLRKEYDSYINEYL